MIGSGQEPFFARAPAGNKRRLGFAAGACAGA
jgi:hypothetical protein